MRTVPEDGRPVGSVRVSVCMATYDGAAWVGEMARSVLAELGERDELVVVDDASSDATCQVLTALDDPRIRLLRNETNAGSVRSFERALAAAAGDYLLLADQDDVWVSGRLEAMVAALDRARVVADERRRTRASRWTRRDGRCRPPTRPGTPPMSRRCCSESGGTSAARWAYAATPWRWCCRSRPGSPSRTTSGSGIVGNALGSISHLQAASVQRRLHDSNQTPEGWRSLPQILRARLMLARCVVEARRRVHHPGAPWIRP